MTATVAGAFDFQKDDTDIELPDTQTVADGSFIIVSRLNQASTTTVSLENATDDAFVGVSIGTTRSTSDITVAAGEVIMFASSSVDKTWVIISKQS